MRRRRPLDPVSKGDLPIEVDAETFISALEALFAPFVEERIAPRVAQDRRPDRCTPLEAKRLGSIAATFALVEGRGFETAGRIARRTSYEFRHPPDLSPEEERAVIAEFVRDETTSLVRFWLGVLEANLADTKNLQPLVPLDDDMLPEGYVVTERACLDFIYLGPDDVRHVLGEVNGALLNGINDEGANLVRLIEHAVRPS